MVTYFLLFVSRSCGLSVPGLSVRALGTKEAPSLSGLQETVGLMRRHSSTKDMSDLDLAWFARDRKGDVEAAVAKVEKWRDWRRTFGGLARDRRGLKKIASEEARKRVGYLAPQRDALGRPAVIVVARRHSVSSRSLASSQALCVDVLEDAVAALTDIDGVEQFVAIVDLRHVGADQVDIQFLLWLVSTLRSYYPKRLGQVALVDPPTLIFKTAWALIEPALGKHAALVRLLKANDLQRQYFPKGNLPPDLDF